MYKFLILFSYMKFMLLYDCSSLIIHIIQNNSISLKVVLNVSGLSIWLNKRKTIKVFSCLKWYMFGFCLFSKPGLTLSSQSIQLNFIFNLKYFHFLKKVTKNTLFINPFCTNIKFCFSLLQNSILYYHKFLH